MMNAAGGGATSAWIGARLLLPRKPFPSAGSAAAGASERFAAGARVPAVVGSALLGSVAPIDADGISVGASAT